MRERQTGGQALSLSGRSAEALAGERPPWKFGHDPADAGRDGADEAIGDPCDLHAAAHLLYERLDCGDILPHAGGARVRWACNIS